MSNTEIKSFETRMDAFDWMHDKVNDECIDNDRFAYMDDDAGMRQYNRQCDHGCCGSFDADIIVDGKPARIGCNYGH